MSEDGKCLQRGFGYQTEGLIMPTILIVLAFTMGLFTSNLFRSLFGVVSSLNQRKSSSFKSPLKHDELPKLPANIPKHVAVIMDGNRRYGRQKHSDALQGHWAGGQTLVDFIQWCIQDGLEIATVYAFSTENWNRDPGEINTLMSIFAKYAESLTTEASTRNVRVRILSTDFDKLPPNVRSSVAELERATADCTGFLVNICLSYGSRAEIVMACNAAITEKHTRSQMIREEVGGLMPTPGLKSASQSIRQNRSSLSDGDSIIDHNATAVFADDVDKTAFGIDNSDNNCAGNHEGLSAVKCVSMNDVKSVRNHSANNHRIKSGCIEGEGMSRGYVEEEKTSPCAGSSSSAKRSSQHSTLSTCFGDESSIEDREILSSLLLDEESIARHLCTANIPDPDILIRTSGEYRVSNFLLWQMAYTEMFFVDKFWPEISHRDLRLVLQEFHDRQRRFGV